MERLTAELREQRTEAAAAGHTIWENLEALGYGLPE